MTEETKADFLSTWSFQDYLSFGYLYLLLLGVVSDSIYYGMLGINIISHSTILDVLLSPVMRLTDNLVFPLVIIVMPLFGYSYVKLIVYLSKKKIDRDVAAGKEVKSPASSKHINAKTLWFIMSAIIIFSAFFGYGIGGGHAQSSRLQSGDFELDFLLEFQDGQTEKVRKIGNNSEYFFYIRAGEKTVTVSPIKDTLTSFRELHDSERD